MALSDLQVRMAASSAEIPSSGWDAMLGHGDFKLSTTWLPAAERLAPVPHCYLIASLDGRVVGGLPVARLEAEMTRWPLGRPDTLLRRLAEDGSAKARQALEQQAGHPLTPSLVCGGRHLGLTRILLSHDLEPPDRLEVCHALLGAAEGQAAQTGARSVCLLYVSAQDTAPLAVFQERGYCQVQSGNYAYLRVGAGGMDECLSRLNSKRRRSIAYERRRLRAAGLSSEFSPLTSDLFPRMAEMETALFDKYKISWTQQQCTDSYRELLQKGSDDVHLILARDGEREPRGFALFFRWRNEWYARNAGFDYGWKGSLPIYYELVFYRPMEEARRFGVQRINYGLGSEQAKTARGCDEDAQFAMIKAI